MYLLAFVVLVGPLSDGIITQDKHVQEGDVVTITCSLKEGDLPLSFDWMTDENQVISLPSVKVVNNEFSSVLTIMTTASIHAGNYYCRASNPVSWTTMKTRVFVNGAVANFFTRLMWESILHFYPEKNSTFGDYL